MSHIDTTADKMNIRTTTVSGSKPETEEEIRKRVKTELVAELDEMIDQRVSGAKKKWETKYKRESAESFARAEKLRMIREEEELKEMKIKEHELLIRGARLDIVDLVAENGLDGRFRDLIPYEDLLVLKNPVEIKQELKKRVIDIKREFDKLVKQEVKRQIESLQNLG